MQCSQDYGCDSIQRGLVSTPKQRYLQSNYYLQDFSQQVVDFSGKFDFEKKVAEVKASFSGLTGYCYNREETDMQKRLISVKTEGFVNQLKGLSKY